jgi:hypothetical protein
VLEKQSAQISRYLLRQAEKATHSRVAFLFWGYKLQLLMSGLMMIEQIRQAAFIS